MSRSKIYAPEGGGLAKTVGIPQDQRVRDTHPGQAHFAGTGPRGTTCGQCAHWQAQRITRRKGTTAAPCAMHKKLRQGRQEGKAVPRSTSSCKYFEEAVRTKKASEAAK